MIQESKFLGGDMEHTHLVKGLDFALLQKVSPDNTPYQHVQKPLPHLCCDNVLHIRAMYSTIPSLVHAVGISQIF